MNGTGPGWWAVARAAGIVAWVLATGSVVWGTWVSTRFTRRPSAAWVLDVHRFLGGSTVAFVGLHLGALVADSYVHFGAADILVPFAAGWRPVPVAFGVCSFWLLIAVETTSLAMRRLSRRLWRVVHQGAYGCWGLATLHTLTAGTERAHPLARLVALASVLLVGGLSTVRVLTARHAARHRSPRARAAVGTATAAAARRTGAAAPARPRAGTAARG